MKKVLIMHDGGGIGGAPVSLLNMASRLDRTLYKPKIVFSRDGPILDMAQELGVSTGIMSMPGAFHYGAHNPVRIRTFLPALAGFGRTVLDSRSLVRTEIPDLIHLNTSALLAPGLGVHLAQTPIVWHVREVVNPGTILGGLMAGWIFQMADRIIAVSQYVANGLPSGSKISVVNNAVDTDHFDSRKSNRVGTRAKLQINETDLVVGILGSVQDVKGHFLLVEAARHILADHPDAKFMVLGGGAPSGYERTWKGRVKKTLGIPIDNEDKMRRLVGLQGMNSSFRFCGYRKDVAPYVAAMDIVVAPALLPEGCPRPLLEGMASERPVIASDVGPSREIMGDGAGLLCVPGSAESLAKTVTRLGSAPDLRCRMGKTGRARALSRFNIDSHVRAVTEVYESALTSK